MQAALGSDLMDVVYLYCHIVDDPNWPDRQVPAIQLGAEQVNAKDIRGWARYNRGRPWSRRHPLVILNGCGSAARPPGSLSNLVEAFTDGAGASGVIGTEITIEQGLGGWAMELFLSALRDQPAGAAMRSMRWGMFAHGNLTGLAYTRRDHTADRQLRLVRDRPAGRVRRLRPAVLAAERHRRVRQGDGRPTRAARPPR